MFRDSDNAVISTQCHRCRVSEMFLCEATVFGPDEPFRFWFEDVTDSIKCREKYCLKPLESMAVSSIFKRDRYGIVDRD